jgi:hypothetical protein
MVIIAVIVPGREREAHNPGTSLSTSSHSAAWFGGSFDALAVAKPILRFQTPPAGVTSRITSLSSSP